MKIKVILVCMLMIFLRIVLYLLYSSARSILIQGFSKIAINHKPANILTRNIFYFTKQCFGYKILKFYYNQEISLVEIIIIRIFQELDSQ